VGGFVLGGRDHHSRHPSESQQSQTIAHGQPIEGENSQNRGAFFILLVYLLVWDF